MLIVRVVSKPAAAVKEAEADAKSPRWKHPILHGDAGETTLLVRVDTIWCAWGGWRAYPRR